MQPTLAFLGAGSMGTAIMSGIFRSKTPLNRVTATSNSQEGEKRIHDAMPAAEENTGWETLLTTFALANDNTANQHAVADADYVIIGTKPHSVATVANDIKNSLKPDAVVISIAAGIPLQKIQDALNPGQPIARAMPNTPAIVGAGLTGIAYSDNVSEKAQTAITALFNTTGTTTIIPEHQIDALTAISGSGPAYVFYLIEEFTTVAKKQGFTVEQAATLAEQTFYGASLLLKETQATPTELRQRVTSPNGTTEAALNVLMHSGLETTIENTITAAIRRAKELAQD